MRGVEGRRICISLRGNPESTKGDLEFIESGRGCRNSLRGNPESTEGESRCHREGCRNSLRRCRNPMGRNLESGIHRGVIHDPGPGIWNLFLVCHKWDEMTNHYR